MITLTVPKNRYWGLSKSGKSHSFNLSAKGPHFYYIPVSSVVSFEERENDIEIKFDKWALDVKKHGEQLRWALTRIKHGEYKPETIENFTDDEEDKFAFY